MRFRGMTWRLPIREQSTRNECMAPAIVFVPVRVRRAGISYCSFETNVDATEVEEENRSKTSRGLEPSGLGVDSRW